MKLRLASYNVENLFHRTAILNLPDPQQSSELLEKVRQLQTLLDADKYDDALKDRVFSLTSNLQPYVDLRVDGGSLGSWKNEAGKTGFRINKSCQGEVTGWASWFFVPKRSAINSEKIPGWSSRR
ncbi:hypothetical protein HAT91_00292 [Dickeya solani]|nr:hypothetical protein HAT91_00292 [Dickeya solani]